MLSRKVFALICLTGLLAGFSVWAGSDGGAGFREAAQEYEVLAEKAAKSGKRSQAKDYRRMAEIKRHAAKLADQGRWDEIDWSEYHKISNRVQTRKESNKADKKKH